MAYVEILISSLLFSLMFVFHRWFSKSEGSDLRAAMLFAFLTSVVRIITVCVTGGLDFSTITWFPLLITFLMALCSITYIFMSAKAFAYADMALYSTLAMLGGMALPFAYGILFCGEPLTLVKGVCFVLVVAAILVGVEFKKSGSKWAPLYYAGVFVLNGMSGVFATINQNSPLGVSPDTYLFLLGAFTILISGILLVKSLFGHEKLIKSPKNALLGVLFYGIFCTVGNLLLQIALKVLPASVQYPFSTGGTMAFSAIVALCMREKLSVRSVASTVIAILATVLLVFA